MDSVWLTCSATGVCDAEVVGHDILVSRRGLNGQLLQVMSKSDGVLRMVSSDLSAVKNPSRRLEYSSGRTMMTPNVQSRTDFDIDPIV